MKSSSSEAFLKGKQFPGFKSKVESVLIRGEKRIVVGKDPNERVTLTKSDFKEGFDAALQTYQKKVAMDSMVKHRDGTATVRIGGEQKGENRHYSTPGRAAAAVNRAYKKAL